MKPPEDFARLLPARRAFVVQLSVEADLTREHWVGRVEHVVSGQVRHFQTLDALLGFVAQILAGESPVPPGPPTRDVGHNTNTERSTTDDDIAGKNSRG
jgi:hypothetical protein